MSNTVYICSFYLHQLTWVQRCWPLATPVFGSVIAISSFLLQDISRHPETRFLEVWEVFKHGPLPGFQANIPAGIVAHISYTFCHRRGPLREACARHRAKHLATPVAPGVTDAEALIGALVWTPLNQNRALEIRTAHLASKNGAALSAHCCCC